jgi:transcription initiation factor TFIIIB Brf1 subunit/transcription initiation factor TFIIB
MTDAPRTASDWVADIVGALDLRLGDEAEARARDLADSHDAARTPHTPRTVAAAAVYVACEERQRGVTRAMLAAPADRHPDTISACVARLREREYDVAAGGETAGDVLDRAWARAVGGDGRC